MVDMNGQDGDSFQFLWGWGLRAGGWPLSLLPPTQNPALSLSVFSTWTDTACHQSVLFIGDITISPYSLRSETCP